MFNALPLGFEPCRWRVCLSRAVGVVCLSRAVGASLLTNLLCVCISFFGLSRMFLGMGTSRRLAFRCGVGMFGKCAPLRIFFATFPARCNTHRCSFASHIVLSSLSARCALLLSVRWSPLPWCSQTCRLSLCTHHVPLFSVLSVSYCICVLFFLFLCFVFV